MRSSHRLPIAVVAIVVLALIGLPASAAAPIAADQSVFRTTMAPALDGNLSDWDGVPSMVLDLDTRATNSSGPVARSDAMYTLQLLQASDALYLGFHARDEKLVADSGVELHKDDSLRFSVDGNMDGLGGAPSDHAYRIRIDGKVNDGGGPELDAIKVYTTTTPVGYNMEIKIPASALALPLGSTSFKFNWGAGDDDNGGGLDTFYLYAGTGVDVPEAAWPLATLDGASFTPPGLLEGGRWEWYGGGSLGAIDAGAGANVWAGGIGVWKTANNGTSWSRSPLLANAEIGGLRFWDPNRGLALAGNKVYLTEDGTATWRLSYDTGANLVKKMIVTSTDTAWLAIGVADSYGGFLHDSVIRSRDGGASWQWVLNTGDPTLDDFAAYGADRAWVLEGTDDPSCQTFLRRTVDGGAGWTSACLADGTGTITGIRIAFADPLTGYLVGQQGTIYSQVWKTVDGGVTWTKQGLSVENARWLATVDANTAWVRTESAQLFRTTDGATWNKIGEGAPPLASFRSPSEGWGIDGGAIRRTTNGGATWASIYTLTDAPIARWWDHLRGWRINGPTIDRTADGGGTWTPVNTGLPAVDHLQMVTPLVGWAWHDASLGLRKTTDGGATWKPQTTGSDSLEDLQFVSTAAGWVRDSANNLRRTTDGGLTWQLVASPPMPVAVPGITNTFDASLYFVNANVGMFGVTRYAGSSNCAPFYSRTVDGGLTWGALQSGPSGAFSFGSGQVGWGVDLCHDGQGPDALYKTADAGASWAPLPPLGFLRSDLHAQDVEQLFAFGNGIPADRSGDGGNTFQRQRSEAPNLTLRSRLDRMYNEEPGSPDARLIYRKTEIPAYRTFNAPRIDGNLDDWGRAWQTSLKTSNAATVTGGIPAPLQSSGVLRALWDANNLYLAVQVYDQQIWVDTPDKPWHDDSVELALDPAHDHVFLTPDDDRQYTITADGAQYLWGQPTTGLEVGRQATADGYILEVRIPKNRVPSLKLQAGGIAGFNFSVINDMDGGTRETQMLWTGSATSRAQAAWGQIRFSAIDAETQPSDDTPTPTPTATGSPTPTATPTATPPAGVARLSGNVWHDIDGNRQIDAGEPFLVGVAIRLYKGGTQIGETVTDGAGNYAFENLLPGAYVVREQQPSWLKFSSTPNEVDLVIDYAPVTVNFGDWFGINGYLPVILK